MDKRYDPVIFSKLQSYAHAEDWQGMKAYLASLSHSAFRTASYVMAERVLPPMEAEHYWACFHHIALSDTKAFLMTFIKAALQKYAAKGLDFANHHFLDFAQGTAGQQVSLDRQKTLIAILPVLRTHSEVQQVLSAFCNDDAERKAIYLVKANESVPCYYELFLALRHMDHTPDMQVRFLLHVARRSTPLAFNFVSIMRAYFGIEKLNGQFSLTLQPYELSRLESGYDGFVKIMNKIK